jgi:hypothetical protein
VLEEVNSELKLVLLQRDEGCQTVETGSTMIANQPLAFVLSLAEGFRDWYNRTASESWLLATSIACSQSLLATVSLSAEENGVNE